MAFLPYSANTGGSMLVVLRLVWLLYGNGKNEFALVFKENILVSIIGFIAGRLHFMVTNLFSSFK
jgi:hypothetical protein